jgi:hypothetical protein
MSNGVMWMLVDADQVYVRWIVGVKQPPLSDGVMWMLGWRFCGGYAYRSSPLIAD